MEEYLLDDKHKVGILLPYCEPWFRQACKFDDRDGYENIGSITKMVKKILNCEKWTTSSFCLQKILV